MEVIGKYNSAKIFAKNVDETTIEQVKTFLDQDFTEGSQIRIMPDCHAGAGCVIGFTADLGDKVIPNIVGVDIGCGMLVVELGQKELDLEKLDEIIHREIPAGFKIHRDRRVRYAPLQDMYCYRDLKNVDRFEKSIGTLGGGNHFIEIDKDDEGNLYLVIHSGSRNLGNQIAEHYQNLAVDMHKGMDVFYEEKERIIEEYKALGKRKKIQKKLKQMRKKYKKAKPKYPRGLCYLEGTFRKQYLHDMKIAQDYALLNRETMATIIIDQLWDESLEEYDHWHTIHNYIDLESNIIRKGAISAQKGEKILIPLNMRDGALICEGKGNPEWNYSAPHGAGRIMSRTEARRCLNMNEFSEEMEGIYTSSVNRATLDEAPMAYKPMEEIVEVIGDTATILKHIKPIYNFKA